MMTRYSEKKKLPAAPRVSSQSVVDAVTRHFSVTLKDLRSKCRKNQFVYPRQIAMVLLWRHAIHNCAKVGRYFRRDHTTVVYARRTILGYLSVDPAMKEEFEYLEQSLLNTPA